MQALDSLVLPNLSYTSDVWGAEGAGDLAECVHREFLIRLLGQHCKCHCAG